MIYPYLSFEGRADTSDSIYPLIPILLLYQHQLIKTPILGLIDSGAEYCYAHEAISQYFRIKLRRTHPIISRAANGTTFTGFAQTVNAIVQGRTIELPLVFTDQLNPALPLILGQRGFFSNFQVCFIKSQNEFSLDQ